jgi:ABC transporter substrate binding protein
MGETRRTRSGAQLYVVRILNGAKPSELPVEQPSKVELVINLETARALGIAVPPIVISCCDEVTNLLSTYLVADAHGRNGTTQTIGAEAGVRQLPKVNRTSPFRRPQYTSCIESTACVKSGYFVGRAGLCRLTVTDLQ